MFLTVCIYSRDSYWQSALYLLLSMFTSSFLYAIFPFEGRRKNYVENFNELVTFGCALLQMVLVGCTIKSRPKQVLANFIIAGVSFMIMANSFLFVSDLGHQATLEFKRRYGRWKAAQQIVKRRIVVQKYSSSNSDEVSEHSE